MELVANCIQATRAYCCAVRAPHRRVLVTGTPFQNAESELRNLVNLSNPGIFGDRDSCDLRTAQDILEEARILCRLLVVGVVMSNIRKEAGVVTDIAVRACRLRSLQGRMDEEAGRSGKSGR